jgi:uncharacterized protein YjeT (DUF2065 family)
MWDDVVRAIALLLVFEGILPFLSPDGWRRAMIQAGQLSDKVLRVIGLSSMLAGVLILYLVH